MCESAVTFTEPPEVAQAFTSAAITALQELTQLEALSEGAPGVALADLTTSIVTASLPLMRAVSGRMTLALSAVTALRIATRYLPEGTQLTEEIIDDVVGEFANVIAGQAKTILKGTPYHFTMTTPVVARTRNSSQSTDMAGSPMAISLATEAGRILVLVYLAPCPGA